MNTLFDTAAPVREWSLIGVKGFAAPVPGVLFRGSRKPCCGVPVGGLATGCVDIDAAGAWGYNSMFNGYTFNPDSMRIPRVAPTLWPMLGLAVDGQVWVLATKEIVDGGLIPCCTEPFILKGALPAFDSNSVCPLRPIVHDDKIFIYYLGWNYLNRVALCLPGVDAPIQEPQLPDWETIIGKDPP